jgi:hypothetical protein
MKTFAINFTKEQMQALNDALIELPFKKAQPLIAHINAEIQKSFVAAANVRDERSGQVPSADEFRGD